MPDLSVAIVSYNTRDLLRECLDTLVREADSVTTDIVVVDNGSTDGSVEMLQNYRPSVTLISSAENLGFAAANNIALARASAPIVLLLNSDAFITSEAISQALRVLRDHPQVGMVGVRLRNPDGSVQAEAGHFPTFWDDVRTSLGFDQLRAPRSVECNVPTAADWVHGACMFVRSAAVQEVGGLEPRYFMYSEEVDWCRRFWDAGWHVWYLPNVDIVHIGGASSRSDTRRRVALYNSRLGFRRRVSGPLASLGLWVLMLVGLSLRIVLRPLAQWVLRRRLGTQTSGSDSALIAGLLRVDPLARWAAS